MNTNFRILVAIVGNFSFDELIARMDPPLTVPYDLVRNADQYNSLSDKYSYDCMVVLYGGPFM
jgi:hypothetical protein